MAASKGSFNIRIASKGAFNIIIGSRGSFIIRSKTNQKRENGSHQISEQAGKIFSCKQCNYQTIFQTNLDVHLKSSHISRKYPCEECNYQARHKSNLVRHEQLIPRKIGIHVCNVTNKQLRKATWLTI